MTSYYGKMLVSLRKAKNNLGNDRAVGILEDLVVSANAVAVPLGAALAIAVASCAFGDLHATVVHRRRIEKYFYQLHSLKHI